MELELQYYADFVLLNGMKNCCKISQKSEEFLLRALYFAVGINQANYFFLKGAKDYENNDEIMKKIGINPEMFGRMHAAHEWVINEERKSFVQTTEKLLQKLTKLNEIDKYKNLELKKSIIFKHMKSKFKQVLSNPTNK